MSRQPAATTSALPAAPTGRGSIALPFPRLLSRGTLRRRLGRFLAEVEVDGQILLGFLANSGRLPGLMEPGTPVWLAAVEGSRDPKGHPGGSGRRTSHDLVLVEQPHSLVCVDTRVPNALMKVALCSGALPDFACYPRVQPESRYGHSRFDFRLSDRQPEPGDAACLPCCLPECLIEVKSVTLQEGIAGLFPDAPTTRGQRHVAELAEAVREGHRTAIAFVVQREDVEYVAPHDAMDPAFGKALRAAARAGVEVRAYGCNVSPEGISLRGELEVRL